MSRRVITVERSPLARNVYSMLLSSLDEIEFVNLAISDSEEVIEKNAKNSDLLLLNQSVIQDRKKEFLDILSRLSTDFKIPTIIFVHLGSKSSWKEFDNIEKVKIIERPFSPDNFSCYVKKLWEVK